MKINLLRKAVWRFCFIVAIATLLLSSKAFASSLYTISGPSGGTAVGGYYTSPPSLTFVLDSSYPEPCVASGGTIPGNGTISVTLSSSVGSNLDGSYDWQVLEDSVTHALLVTNDGNWHDGHIIDACNWNGPNPNWQVVWDQNISYDMSNPTVSITSPTNNANETSDNVTVSGTASDNGSGVKSVTINGVMASVSNGNFTASVPLSMGLNALVATATDKVGHQTQSAQVTVFRYENASSGSSSSATGANVSSGSTKSTTNQGSSTINGTGSQNTQQPTTKPSTPISTPVKAAAGVGVVGATGLGVASFMGYIPYKKIGLLVGKLFIK